MDFRVTMLLQALNKTKKPNVVLSEQQWDQCIDFAAEHGLECVFFDYYNPWFDPKFKLTSVYKKWKMYIVHQIFWTKASEEKAVKVLSQLKTEGIFTVILKGIDLATYYDKPENRVMSDMDLLISPNDIEKTEQVFKSLNYIHAKEEDTDKERIYYPTTEGYFFEVHHALFKKKMSSYTDKFSNIALNTAIYSEKLEFNVLEPSVSTAYMVIHMAKHLYGTGIGLKGLYDLSIYLKAQKKNINEEKLVEYLKSFNMLRTGAYIIACADKYLQSNFNMDYPIDETICNNLFGMITRAGDTGMREEYAIEQRYEDLAQKKMDSSKKSMHRLQFVFLPLKQMRRRYPFLNTHSWLLPFFWGVRIFRVLFKSRQNFIKWIRHDINHDHIFIHKETLKYLKED